MNGVVDYTAQTCTTCHGDAARTGIDAAGIAFSSAPPADATGPADRRHQGRRPRRPPPHRRRWWPQLLEAGRLHRVPQRRHPDQPAPRQRPGQRRLRHPRQDRHRHPVLRLGGTCSNTYCHGNFQNGAGANPISWTTAAITCNSCHGTPPGGTHPAGSTLATCGNCHGNYSNATQSIINPAGHVDGSIDLSNMSCTSCHGTTGRPSVAGADLNQAVAPPVVASATGVPGSTSRT